MEKQSIKFKYFNIMHGFEVKEHLVSSMPEVNFRSEPDPEIVGIIRELTGVKWCRLDSRYGVILAIAEMFTQEEMKYTVANAVAKYLDSKIQPEEVPPPIIPVEKISTKKFVSIAGLTALILFSLSLFNKPTLKGSRVHT